MCVRFNMDTRHIKVTYSEGLYRINEKKAFKGLIVSLLCKVLCCFIVLFCVSWEVLYVCVCVLCGRSWFSIIRRTHWENVSKTSTQNYRHPTNNLSRTQPRTQTHKDPTQVTHNTGSFCNCVWVCIMIIIIEFVCLQVWASVITAQLKCVMISQPVTALNCHCGRETPWKSSPRKLTTAGGEERSTAG